PLSPLPPCEHAGSASPLDSSDGSRGESRLDAGRSRACGPGAGQDAAGTRPDPPPLTTPRTEPRPEDDSRPGLDAPHTNHHEGHGRAETDRRCLTYPYVLSPPGCMLTRGSCLPGPFDYLGFDHIPRRQLAAKPLVLSRQLRQPGLKQLLVSR